MKRLIAFCVCVLVFFVCLDHRWYVGATVSFGGCLVLAAPTSMLSKRRSTRTTKPGVLSTREKAA